MQVWVQKTKLALDRKLRYNRMRFAFQDWGTICVLKIINDFSILQMIWNIEILQVSWDHILKYSNEKISILFLFYLFYQRLFLVCWIIDMMKIWILSMSYTSFSYIVQHWHDIQNGCIDYSLFFLTNYPRVYNPEWHFWISIRNWLQHL